MEADRLNSPDTSVITLELLGHQLQFSQDPNSKHHGTTVWDASLVLVKFLEKNSRKGRFCPSKLKGKRVIELGAGCGVAGFGMALLGCDVVATDQAEVLPLLRRNVERNTSRILQTNPDSLGSIQVAELDWGNGDHIKAIHPPFDYIIGTDIVYAEQLLEPLLRTMTALSGSKTTILLGYEVRSTGVHQQMLNLWKRNFDFKTVPLSKMHHKYQHPSIQLFIMGPKPVAKTVEETTQKADDLDVKTCCVNEKADEAKQTEDSESGSSSGVDQRADCGAEGAVKRECSILEKLKTRKLSEWEARRYGSIAARLLRDINIK
ncbi:protein-lysine methyltransferase METTL21D [Punica granatum]|uniref:Protein-lysine methyltransferase METTL21D n=1 Tax=Punica granatum TaxID=22663 RepID=A0A6P8DDN8_PUNGR|nr:protein-lysine methyltransferase METTL21D [Punica granatum]